MPWKTINVTRSLYLPTAAADGQFKNTGLRVEPSDKIEIETGTHNLRINGALHTLFIPCDSLRLNAEDTIVTDRAAPPVASISGGGGGERAFVGRVGQARASAYIGNGGSWESLNQPPAPRTTQEEAHAVAGLWDEDPPMMKANDAKLHQTFAEDRVVRTVTLKDGTQAEVLIDPTTGRSAGYTQRAYSGVGADPKEAARLLAEQNYDAKDVTYRAPQPHAPPQQPARPPATPQPTQGCPTGFGPTFDGLLNAAIGQHGFPKGAVTFLQAPDNLLTSVLDKMALSQTTNIELAFARIHMPQVRPGVVVHLPPTPSPETLLELAEHLPVLLDVVKTQATMAVILAAPWSHNILARLAAVHVTLAQSTEDPRFLIATTVTPVARSASFPA